MNKNQYLNVGDQVVLTEEYWNQVGENGFNVSFQRQYEEEMSWQNPVFVEAVKMLDDRDEPRSYVCSLSNKTGYNQMWLKKV